jgi:hypothetical protein
MNKKVKSAKKSASKKPMTQPMDLLRANQLLGYTRQPKSAEERLQLLNSIDEALENAYQVVRLLPNGIPEEEECLQGIRNLEDRRFELLSEIHGNQVQAYRWITS